MSTEWEESRRGLLTASAVGDIMAGKKTKRHTKYVAQLVREIKGAPLFNMDDDPPWFRHGKEAEPYLRAKYAFDHPDHAVTEPGLVRHREHSFIAATPDGHVSGPGVHGLMEIKARRTYKNYIRSLKKIEPDYMKQMQMQMWVTEEYECVFITGYVHGPRIYYKDTLIERDEKMIKKIEAACLSTWEEIQAAL